MNQQLRARLFVLASLAFLSASDAMAQVSAGGKNDPLAVTKSGFCGQGKFIDILTNPLFLGLMVVFALIAYGYQTNIGKADGTVALQRTGVGVVVIACAVTIASFFVKVC
jgi:hypothetical protein